MLKAIHNMSKRNKKGFTLIELLIVIAIIAILAAIAIPQFAAYRARGVRASMVSDGRNTITQLTALVNDEGTYADALSQAATTGPGPASTPIAGTTQKNGYTISVSRNNTLTITTGDATDWAFNVANTDAGQDSASANFSPLAMQHIIANTPQDKCEWNNKAPC